MFPSSVYPKVSEATNLICSDLEIPAPPLPVLLDDEGCFDDILPPLPPPADDDPTLQSLEKGIISVTSPLPPSRLFFFLFYPLLLLFLLLRLLFLSSSSSSYHLLRSCVTDCSSPV